MSTLATLSQPRDRSRPGSKPASIHSQDHSLARTQTSSSFASNHAYSPSPSPRSSSPVQIQGPSSGRKSRPQTATDHGAGGGTTSEFGAVPPGGGGGTSSSVGAGAGKPPGATVPPEIFIIVRPPPSKHNHPMNLQIQLLTPGQNQGRSYSQSSTASRASGDFGTRSFAEREGGGGGGGSTPGGAGSGFSQMQLQQPSGSTTPTATGGHTPAASSFQAVAIASPASGPFGNESSGGGVGGVNVPGGGGELKRTPSTRSNRSSVSAVSSGGGVSVSGSGSSSITGGERARMMPLYNLHCHTMMTTTVSDAGNDAKIAKFNRRGIELLGFGILEPTELGATAIRPSSTLWVPTARGPSPSPSDSSAAVSTDGQNIVGSPPILTPQKEESKAAGFFNRFKRISLRPGTPSTPVSVPGTGETTPTAVTSPSGRNSFQFGVGGPGGGLANLLRPKTAQTTPVSGVFPTNTPPTAALPPSNSVNVIPADGMAPTPMTTGVDLLTGQGIPQGNRAKGYVWTVRRWLRRDLETVRPVEVTFEWKKRRRSNKKQKQQSLAPTAASSSNGHVEGNSSAGHGSPPTSTVESEELAQDPRRLSSHSQSRRRQSVDSRVNAMGNGDDPGEESDPEDSDTPWTCELVLPPFPPDIAPRRILLATLAPAPHHPRLVARLAIPFNLHPAPLPYLRDAGSGFVGAPAGVTGGRPMSMTALSVEEMKDVVSITCFWLVARESLGGLSKRRKGDGSWRIGVK